MAYLYSFYLVPRFEKLLRNGRILDVGCGKGGLGAIFKTVPEKQLRAEIVGLDLDEVLLKTAKNYLDHVVLGRATHLPFKDKYFHVTFAIEVIEHMTKEDGYKMIREMERVTKYLIILTTPSHYFPADTAEGDFMKHKSYWSVKDLKSLGFQTEGLRPVRDWIPPLIAKRIPHLACSTLALKCLKHG